MRHLRSAHHSPFGLALTLIHVHSCICSNTHYHPLIQVSLCTSTHSIPSITCLNIYLNALGHSFLLFICFCNQHHTLPRSVLFHPMHIGKINKPTVLISGIIYGYADSWRKKNEGGVDPSCSWCSWCSNHMKSHKKSRLSHAKITFRHFNFKWKSQNDTFLSDDVPHYLDLIIGISISFSGVV